jgi:hypothetical protein
MSILLKLENLEEYLEEKVDMRRGRKHIRRGRRGHHRRMR